VRSCKRLPLGFSSIILPDGWPPLFVLCDPDVLSIWMRSCKRLPLGFSSIILPDSSRLRGDLPVEVADCFGFVVFFCVVRLPACLPGVVFFAWELFPHRAKAPRRPASERDMGAFFAGLLAVERLVADLSLVVPCFERVFVTIRFSLNVLLAFPDTKIK
jgi:hypothetical protein